MKSSRQPSRVLGSPAAHLGCKCYYGVLLLLRHAAGGFQDRIHDVYQNSPGRQATRPCRSRSGAGRERGPVRSWRAGMTQGTALLTYINVRDWLLAPAMAPRGLGRVFSVVVGAYSQHREKVAQPMATSIALCPPPLPYQGLFCPGSPAFILFPIAHPPSTIECPGEHCLIWSEPSVIIDLCADFSRDTRPASTRFPGTFASEQLPHSTPRERKTPSGWKLGPHGWSPLRPTTAEKKRCRLQRR